MKVVAGNKEAKKLSSILDNDGDTFVKNECKADKWVIIELSQMVKIDTLELSQFELYSSRVKEFEVRGRQNHPRHDAVEYHKVRVPAPILGNPMQRPKLMHGCPDINPSTADGAQK